MNTTLLITLAQGGGNMSFIIMMVVIFAIMWFFMIRPQQKKQKELQNFRNSIGVGTQVVTAGGIYGTVKQISQEDNTLIVEIAKDVKIKVDKNSVFASAPSADKK
ncbi:MAG: preprotein translocase subunit YajC [Prevotellaceae bacterium]|nr:preprotein translocase subunit YajC [Prevotellaceae bacterium]